MTENPHLPPDALLPSDEAPVVPPTQTVYPWRSVARTVFQAIVALATLIPLVAAGVYDGDDNVPAAVAQVLVIAGTLTRIMAIPQVNQFLERFLPFLAAAPKETTP